MSRYRFELATAADDGDLRAILAATPMHADISLAFHREPSYFESAVVEGSFRQVIGVRELESGRIVGFGSRAVGTRYVNGQPEPIGYLSSLRLLPEHRNRGLLVRGFAFLHTLHADRRTPLYLTTIAAGNKTALGLLTSQRAGLPRYEPAGEFHTIAIPLGRRSCGRAPRGVEFGAPESSDLPAMLEFLGSHGPRRQFFPCYEPRDFLGESGALNRLRLTDVLLARKNGAIVGLLASWDQTAERQTVVHGYSRRMRLIRPIFNAWAAIARRPGLPAPGTALNSLSLALPVVANDNPSLLAALIDEVARRHSCSGHPFMLLGLHGRDPLLATIRRWRGASYTTKLFSVYWPDGEPFARRLDARVPYLELGCL